MLTRSSTRKQSIQSTRNYQHRVTNKKRKVDSAAHLPADIFSLVLGHLDPRGMLNLASSNKEILALVTHDMVLRTTVIGGRSMARKNVEKLLQLLRLQNIYLPSPMRMLRILNGRQCEYRGCNGRACKIEIGLLLCRTCWKEKTVSYSWRQKHHEKKYQDILCDNSLFPFNYNRLTKKPFRSVDGKLNGTLFSQTHVERMVREDVTIEEYADDHEIPMPDLDYVSHLNSVAIDAEEIWHIR